MERLTLVPSGGGAFEVTVNGDLVWSKRKTKQFPEIKDLMPALGR
ncbi:MAG: Rdx family protein [Acidimicrobiia bacterium]